MKKTTAKNVNAFDLVRLLLATAEKGVATGDARTVERAVDASEAIFRNLRAAVARELEGSKAA